MPCVVGYPDGMNEQIDPDDWRYPLWHAFQRATEDDEPTTPDLIANIEAARAEIRSRSHDIHVDQQMTGIGWERSYRLIDRRMVFPFPD